MDDKKQETVVDNSRLEELIKFICLLAGILMENYVVGK